MKNKKALIGMAILFLAIGFATVSTTLVVNGILALGESDDFEIIFTSAKLDGKKRNDFISSDKKHIEFTSNTLTDIDDETKLVYEVTNTTRNYDANVSVKCSAGENEYIMFNYTPREMKVLAGETKSGTLTALMLKVTDIERDIPIECTLTAEATERESLGDEYIEPFSRSGVLKSTTYNNTSDFWGYKSNITKVVFEDKMIAHETEENLIFDVSAAKDKSVLAYLVPNGENLTINKDADNKELTDTTAYTLYIQSDTGVKANKDSSDLFYKFNNLLEIENMNYFDTSNVIRMYGMFDNCRNLTAIDVSNFDTSNVTNMSWIFGNCRSLTTVDLSNFDTSNVTNMQHMFYYCSNLTTLDLSNFDTSNVTSMSSLFAFCRNLSTLGVSNFDTSSLTNMSAMFSYCSNLTAIDISRFDTSKVKDMSYTFQGCSNLTNLDVSNFNTSNVTNMESMFANCNNLTALDVRNFDTSNVTTMRTMFFYCSNLTTLDLGNFDTSKVTNMYGMFCGCSSLMTLDISNFDTSNVTTMESMFSYCSYLTTLNISNFDISNVTNTKYMFVYMKTNSIIKVKDKVVQDWILELSSDDRPSSWTTDNVIIAE